MLRSRLRHAHAFDSRRALNHRTRSILPAMTPPRARHASGPMAAADVIFGLEDGHLVERGTHAELLRAGGLYKRLYDEQFSRTSAAPWCDPRRADVPL